MRSSPHHLGRRGGVSSRSVPTALGDRRTAERPSKYQSRIETLDYNLDASKYIEAEMLSQSSQEQRNHAILGWAIFILTGLVMGTLAFILDFAAGHLQTLKFRLTSIASTTSHTAASSIAWATATYVVSCALFVSVAAVLVVFIEPVAGGSGIPEVKSYLSGLQIPRMLHFSTFICKTTGVLCSVSGGLVCGKEGPMIHAGAIVASGLSQGGSSHLSFLARFRNDRDRRDFVSAGAAAGVAAAFGAPIGGVLFALEEAATHWSQALTWRTFLCAVCSTFMLNLLLSGVGGLQFGHLSNNGLINFGSFLGCHDNSYALNEFPIFVAIGLLCGLIGAAFNEANRRLTLFRKAHLATRWRRFTEAVLVGGTTALVCCLLPLVLPCRAAHAPGGHAPSSCHAPEPNELEVTMHALVCASDAASNATQSHMVSLMLSSKEEAIKLLFHQDVLLGLPECLLFFLYACLIGEWTYGIGVPSGLFVPCILMGGAVGRAVGELLVAYGPVAWQAWLSSPGDYALIGAAGMLGGVCRMTISLTVIVVESTGNIAFLIPIAMTIWVAKVVGDQFTEGIYDIHIDLKRFPFLHDELHPAWRSALTATSVMVKGSELHTLRDVETVAKIVHLLRSTTHHGFPVVASPSAPDAHTRSADGSRSASSSADVAGADVASRPAAGETTGPLCAEQDGLRDVLGFLKRDQLTRILEKRQFVVATGPTATDASSLPPPSPVAMTPSDFRTDVVGINRMHFSPEELASFVDLRPYVNEPAQVTYGRTSLRRVSRLFRSMGLRHLLVIEERPVVVGMITRKDILEGGPLTPPATGSEACKARRSPHGSPIMGSHMHAVVAATVREDTAMQCAAAPLLPQ